MLALIQNDSSGTQVKYDEAMDARGRVWARRELIAEVDSPDRVALLDLADVSTATPLALEGSAAEIWRCVDGYRTVAEVIEMVADSYSVSALDVAESVEEFIAELAELGLLVILPTYGASS